MNRPIVEGFDSDIASQIKFLSDLELKDILSNPETGSAILADNVKKTTSLVLNDKKQMLRSLSDEVDISDTNLINTAYYLSRNRDLVNLATDVNKIASEQVNTSSVNQTLTARQNEINEWSNFSKLEILYFMQIIFISLSLSALFAYLLSIGYISGSLFWTLVSITFIIDLLIIVLKSRFTMINRDGRYWHKMRFASQPHAESSSSKCS